LIDNAVQAMRGQGELTLATRRDGDAVVVEVTDTGPGIPPEIRPRIFDPFFTTKAPGEGTGLGLSISHGIVTQRHKGSITVESRPGRTTFRV
ncbi:ATP-binding protein, partial [Escherichia coli]|nr:ATP-binding protein [Escherichia coli]